MRLFLDPFVQVACLVFGPFVQVACLVFGPFVQVASLVFGPLANVGVFGGASFVACLCTDVVAVVDVDAGAGLADREHFNAGFDTVPVINNFIFISKGDNFKPK